MPMFWIDPNSQPNLIRTRSDEAIDPRTGEKYELRRKYESSPLWAVFLAILIALMLL